MSYPEGRRKTCYVVWLEDYRADPTRYERLASAVSTVRVLRRDGAVYATIDSDAEPEPRVARLAHVAHDAQQSDAVQQPEPCVFVAPLDDDAPQPPVRVPFLLALMTAAVVALCTCSLAGCAALQRPAMPPQTALERAVAAAGLAAWAEAGLPVTPAVRAARALRIERPTHEAWAATCPQERVPAACLAWRGQGDVPVAVLAPWLPESHVAVTALHELLHALVYRSGLRSDYDHEHTDGRVWAGFSWSLPGNVEERAQAALD